MDKAVAWELEILQKLNVRDMESDANHRDYLTKIRANTSYAALRVCVGIGSLLSGFGVASVLGVSAVNLLSSEKSFDYEGAKIVIGFIAFGIGIFLSFAFHQASSLLIDMADMLIDQHHERESKHKIVEQPLLVPTPVTQSDIESRLSSLNLLLSKGFVSEEEYRLKKAAILKEIKS